MRLPLRELLLLLDLVLELSLLELELEREWLLDEVLEVELEREPPRNRRNFEIAPVRPLFLKRDRAIERNGSLFLPGHKFLFPRSFFCHKTKYFFTFLWPTNRSLRRRSPRNDRVSVAADVGPTRPHNGKKLCRQAEFPTATHVRRWRFAETNQIDLGPCVIAKTRAKPKKLSKTKENQKNRLVHLLRCVAYSCSLCCKCVMYACIQICIVCAYCVNMCGSEINNNNAVVRKPVLYWRFSGSLWSVVWMW